MSDPLNHNDSQPNGAGGQDAASVGDPYGSYPGAPGDPQVSAHGAAPAAETPPSLGKNDAASQPPQADPGAQPQPGAPYGGQPQQGSPYGAQQGAPYGAPPQQGAPYGGQPQQGSPYGAQQGSPYGAPPQQGPPYGGGQPPYGGQPQGSPYASAPADASQRQIGMFAHLLNIIGVIGPLILWLVTRERGGLAESEGKEATNWGITVLIAGAALGVLSFIVTLVVPPLGVLFMLAGFLLSAVNLVFAIIGGVQVNSTGRPYRYPWTFRFIA